MLFALSLAACGGRGKPAESDQEKDSAESALELLETVWNSYGEEAKFAAAGGDMSEGNMAMDAPGKFGAGDAAALDAALGFPQADVEKIDGAAFLVYMLNANTFTCGAFHVKNPGDLEILCAAVKENIMQRQWMCGFPDRLMVIKVDSYIVSFFGDGEIVETFRTKLAAAYASGETFCDSLRGQNLNYAVFEHSISLLLSSLWGFSILRRRTL